MTNQQSNQQELSETQAQNAANHALSELNQAQGNMDRQNRQSAEEQLEKARLAQAQANADNQETLS